mgnify:CR=1 FL=1
MGTLLHIIQQKVQPGSLVQTDQWETYQQLLRRLGLHHRTIIHSLHFVISTWSEVTYVGSEVTYLMERPHFRVELSNFWLERSNRNSFQQIT